MRKFSLAGNLIVGTPCSILLYSIQSWVSWRILEDEIRDQLVSVNIHTLQYITYIAHSFIDSTIDIIGFSLLRAVTGCSCRVWWCRRAEPPCIDNLYDFYYLLHFISFYDFVYYLSYI